MKILISHDGSNAHFFIRMGIARAFNASGHEVIIWNINNKSAYDIFDEIEPDIFIGQTYNLNNSLINNIKSRPHIKVIMKAGDWSSFTETIDLKKYPILTPSHKEIKLIEELKETTGQPSYVFAHYTQNNIDKTHEYWSTKLGIEIKSNLNAADIFDYTKGKHKEEFESDLFFVGGRWPYKAQTLRRYIDPLLYPMGKYNIKIIGSGWGCNQKISGLPIEEMKNMMASSKICLNVHEPHSQDFGIDVIERPFKLLANKCFCISDYVTSMATEIFTKNELAMTDSFSEFHHAIDYYLRHPEQKQAFIDRGYETVMQHHTYFDRAHDILQNLELDFEAIKMKQTKEKIFKELGL